MDDTKELIGNEEKADTLSTTGSINSNHRGFQIIEQKVRKPEQTFVLFFHGLFKVLASILYIFGSKIGFISSFVFVIIFLSADFWFVKNVSGRLLAGLRWKNFVKEDNSTEWRFESWSPAERALANKFQMRTFWTFLIIHQCIWCLYFMVALFGLHLIWIMIPIVALILNTSNLYGYIRCRWEAKTEESPETGFGLNVTSGLMKNMWATLKSAIINPRGSYSSVPLDETVIHQ